MRRLFSFFTSVMMSVSLMTIPVGAVDSIANVSDRTELTNALKDDSISEINITKDIDFGDEEWIGLEISNRRTLTINGNGHTISNMKSYKALKEPNESGIPGDGGSCDYYNGWIAQNLGTLTINDLRFYNAEVDTNPLTTVKNSTGSSILAVVVANNMGKLVYNNVVVDSSIVRGYTKIGTLIGFTQSGTFTATHSSVINSKVILEADGTDNEACFSGIIAGYDGRHLIKTQGIYLENNSIEIDDSVDWGIEPIYDPSTGVTSVKKYGGQYGLTSETYTINGYGNKAVLFAAGNNGYQYESLNDAIKFAQNGDTITLLRDVTEDIVIPAEKVITLDLNGKKLSNSNSHTITVDNKASLTIIGEGTVDNTSHGKGTIFNNGTVTLNGGIYERSNEMGIGDSNGGNSWYTICNHGVMTINNGVTVNNSGTYSSLIENGYQNYTEYKEGTNEAEPKLTINGGLFTGGINCVKNDEGGILEINDGHFTNDNSVAVMNWNVATINGGIFDAGKYTIVNSEYKTNYNKSIGELKITGGQFNSINNILGMGGGATSLGNIEITGGNFIAQNGQLIDDDFVTEGDVLKVTGGIYQSNGKSDESVVQYIPKDSDIEMNPDTGEVALFHTVTYIVDGQKENVLVKDNTQTLEKDVKVKEGYTFVGWYNGEEKYDFSKPITSDLTLTAKYEINKYTVSFSDGVESQNVEYGKTAVKPADPKREGYTFVGWYNGEEKYDFSKPITSDLNLTAKYEINKYTVSFSDGVESQSVEYGKTAVKPVNPKKEGYTFIGWYSGEKLYDFNTPVTQDITLNAKFEKNVVIAKPNNPKKPEGPSNESKDVATKPNDTPKTGENSLIVLYGLLLTSSAMLVIILEKKKRLMK